MYHKQIVKIANVLMLNLQRLEKAGLMNGYLGVCLFLYHYSRYIGVKGYQQNADDILDYILEKEMKCMNRTISDGLFGLGWSIKYLRRNRFLELSDNILSDFSEIAGQSYTALELKNDLSVDIPIFSRGIFCCDMDNLKLANINLDIIRTIICNSQESIYPMSFLNSVSFFLQKCVDADLKRGICEELLRVMNDLYKNCMAQGVYKISDLLLLKKLKNKLFAAIITPCITSNLLYDVYMDWQSIIYEELFIENELIETDVLDILLYDIINDKFPMDNAMSQLAVLGINLIKRECGKN